MPLADIRGDLIEVDDRAGQGFYTVRVKLHGSESCCHVVIDPDCSYVVGLQTSHLCAGPVADPSSPGLSPARGRRNYVGNSHAGCVKV
jgi:hypothetical protein